MRSWGCPLEMELRIQLWSLHVGRKQGVRMYAQCDCQNNHHECIPHQEAPFVRFPLFLDLCVVMLVDLRQHIYYVTVTWRADVHLTWS